MNTNVPKSDNLTGACLCDAVSFTADGVEMEHHACHCAMCLRWGGGPFMAAKAGNIRFNSEGKIKRHRSSDWAERGFCAECGTHLFYRFIEGDLYYVPVGTFSNPEAFTVNGEIFVDAKPPGYNFEGDHPRLTEAEVLAEIEAGYMDS